MNFEQNPYLTSYKNYSIYPEYFATHDVNFSYHNTHPTIHQKTSSYNFFDKNSASSHPEILESYHYNQKEFFTPTNYSKSTVDHSIYSSEFSNNHAQYPLQIENIENHDMYQEFSQMLPFDFVDQDPYNLTSQHSIYYRNPSIKNIPNCLNQNQNVENSLRVECIDEKLDFYASSQQSNDFIPLSDQFFPDRYNNTVQQIHDLENLYNTEITSMLQMRYRDINPEIYDFFYRFYQNQVYSQYSNPMLFEEFSKIPFTLANTDNMNDPTMYDHLANCPPHNIQDFSKNNMSIQNEHPIESLQKQMQNIDKQNDVESNPVYTFHVDECGRTFYLKDTKNFECILVKNIEYTNTNSKNKACTPIFHGERVIIVPGHDPINLDIPVSD
ncbi:hypothetical protein EDEG_03760 [Edhazardia aedis USNM 41457]|uniref:Uncharacterized protein n=1 Tax=Edhazardia aedis (strain USNM 41457) TaxID=1003232 RepID=J9DK32_EDHAE|nr:hypothetical protein EDEG_03760 [Edhazardia aedis USNM 41457]|eukprot:EJW01717.1 hypothetical protein EDEG_03760 [Edhazardia aedis USNM 41457]